MGPIGLEDAADTKVVDAVSSDSAVFNNWSDEEWEHELEELEQKDSMIAKWAAKMRTGFGVRLDSYISSLRTKESPDPGLFDVIAGSVDIMQDRITRSRMAGEPPDIHITPRLSNVGLMEFDRGQESIEEGRVATRRHKEEILKFTSALENRSSK